MAMEKIIFENLPSENTPLNAENLNTIQDNVENFVNEEIVIKQDKLISGSNIKTINNQNLLGEGNIEISSGTVEQVISQQLNQTSIPANGQIALGALFPDNWDYNSDIWWWQTRNFPSEVVAQEVGNGFFYVRNNSATARTIGTSARILFHRWKRE